MEISADEIEDEAIHTLPVLMGERGARAVVVAMFMLQYALVAYLVAIGFFTPLLLVVFLALPKLRDALRIYFKPTPSARPEAYPADTWPLWFVAYAFGHNRRWGCSSWSGWWPTSSRGRCRPSLASGAAVPP